MHCSSFGRFRTKIRFRRILKISRNLIFTCETYATSFCSRIFKQKIRDISGTKRDASNFPHAELKLEARSLHFASDTYNRTQTFEISYSRCETYVSSSCSTIFHQKIRDNSSDGRNASNFPHLELKIEGGSLHSAEYSNSFETSHSRVKSTYRVPTVQFSSKKFQISVVGAKCSASNFSHLQLKFDDQNSKPLCI